MLETIIKRTQEFVMSVARDDRKRYGQFFTSAETARFMAGLYDIDLSKPEISILDAGAGTGILSAAVVERLVALGYSGRIILTCYETDLSVLPLLKSNLDFIRQIANVSYNVFQDNYITSQPFDDELIFGGNPTYDCVIGNPPYMKLHKDRAEARHMASVCHGVPNLYFLFWAMGIHNLKKNGELVYIVPRSWTSGAYFRRFRQYLFDNAVLQHVHLFVSRDKVFKEENVLQETIVVKVRKDTRKPCQIDITSCSNCEFNDLHKFQVPYSTVVASNGYVFLPTNEEEVRVLSRINSFTDTLLSLHIPMHTGLVVDFRSRELLKDHETPDTCPLFYSSHLRDGKVVWPIGKAGEYLQVGNSGLLQPNANYVFVKRFTSKEEPRRLQCAVYLSSHYPDYEYISTQNKVNFIRCSSVDMLFGIFALLNSTLYDRYYRILNGSTQVNSTEINAIPVPSKKIICSIGRELNGLPLSTSNCNKIIEKWI